MSNFSPLERTIAKTLSKFPWLKKTAKSIYGRLTYFLSKKTAKLICDNPVTLHKLEKEKETFFGYYDKSPSNLKGLVILHTTDQNTKKTPSTLPINVQVFSKEYNKVIFELETSSYNWQQGSRLHWLSDEEFIFNDYDADTQCYGARVFSVISQLEIAKFNFPVQDSFKKEYYLSINYERLMAMRPDYGYRNKPALSNTELSDIRNDGVWKVNFESGDSELIVSISDLCDLFPSNAFKTATHKLNHIMISPNGDKFIFMHRYLINGKRVDRLFVCNNDGSSLKLIADNEMVSHCFWRDSETVFGYLRGENKRDSYWFINVETGEFTEFKNELLNQQGDGHPHVYGDFFVTDTYPDKARMQKLLLGNFETGEVKVIGEFFHGFDYVGETRCDLHPRFSVDGKSIFFDSVYSGKRALCEMEITL